MLPAMLNLIVLQRHTVLARSTRFAQVIRVWPEVRRVFTRQNSDNARRRFCSGQVNLYNPAGRNRALNQRAVSKSRPRKFGGVFGGTDDLDAPVNAGNRLTNQR